MKDVRNILYRLIRKNVGCTNPAPEVDFRADLGAKDLDLLQLVMDCEDEWAGLVYIDDHEFEQIKTVGDLESMVLLKTSQEAAQPQ